MCPGDPCGWNNVLILPKVPQSRSGVPCSRKRGISTPDIPGPPMIAVHRFLSAPVSHPQPQLAAQSMVWKSITRVDRP